MSARLIENGRVGSFQYESIKALFPDQVARSRYHGQQHRELSTARIAAEIWRLRKCQKQS